MSEEIKALSEGIEKISGEIAAKMSEYNTELEKHGAANTELTGKLDALSGQYDEMKNDLLDLAQKGFGPESNEVADETWGAQLLKSDKLEALQKGDVDRIRMEVKNTVLGDSTTVFPNQRQGVIAGDFVPTTVRATMPEVPVSTDAVNALREASFTNAAAETAQGAAKPETDLTFEQYNVGIETIPHWIKVSTRLLADAPAIAAYIDTRLRDGLAQRVDAQLLNGDGTSPNISGLTDAGNFTAFTPDSGANLVDSINKAKWELWAAGYTPDVAFVNPADWGDMERTREGANSGMYLYGLPGVVAGPQAHGVRVVPSVHVTAGTFVIGAIGQACLIYNRQNPTVEMGYINDDFTRNLVTIRAEERLALSVDRASAIKVGNITAA